ncbi:SDR family oxidoreductase [Hoeflea prorocentri]|uniref:SDR family NAD(P)-dependent oxidoreductase n=1 Tax=Hoeflea prorocentri TaxID=1922333 RepID=A0A9X3UL55_9HYPH|nr:SDR family oxidoreductase [Hoeflea prorocentri]MCY6382855.1 SDR family NAD(P)-dependent oxidoreductase [Hoeflea prorocentri]MDA5400655.1 SDR family NAD(P)-dependent oxidoreductase [Hoeflea prorocentri]
MKHLKGKTAIVTGASRGIGEAAARYLARHGVKVVLAARSGGAISAIADDIRTGGGQASAFACDVSDHAAVSALIQHTTQTFGCLDILVNNAGLIDPITRIADSDPETWGNLIDVNIKGVYHGLRYAIPVMLQQEGGTIINLSSGAANSSLEGWSHYCASKAAVLRLTGVAHEEYADAGIRVVGLSPGTVATDMQSAIKASGMNPVSQLDPSVHIPPEWVAQAIGFLCGPDADEFAGADFSLKTDEGRTLAGLPV